MDKKQMLLGFSSKKSSMVITCDHGYHESYFTISSNKKYLYCENVLKLGIQTNISSLLLRLSKLDTKKSNLKEFIDADDNSPQDQRISDEYDILEVL
ncbi:29799_t:CDS:2 [Gigaspora margarita]|uniref:29799_t:CDS:1 n=1 Tax=Gigaspora margarita TaxID=4874 RepID=A0ABM8W556_GIGMA|nr:29799_t:CDS:2 [Gigaspora margarita]